jgi:magnesium-transporting ATPase (P-type)
MFLAADANAGTVLVVIALVLAVFALIDGARAYPNNTGRSWTWVLLCIAVLLVAIALLVGVNAVID